MKLLGVFTVSLLASVVRGAVIKQETSGARVYARRALGVQESSVCEQFFGADYPYICNNNAMCLYCPGKTVGDGTCQVCNGNNECSTGEDEEGCTVHTEPYLNSLCSNYDPDFPFSCATVGSSGVTKCLQESQICDGLWHCEDGSDENSCDYSKQYGTANGQCPVPSQSKLGENAASFDSQMLAAHNYFRCLHGSPSMTTSATMKTQATTAVENSAATSGLQHTFTGENLALMSMPIADAQVKP
ncbi:vitellogenin receptor Yl-like [Ptychodera flava]|uniref:vitellogenin receptor Yl-like n=1 Tax=Ptychodera flava TaxID=63121 RepID=UPI00396AA153